MKKYLSFSDSNIALLVARLSLAIVLFPHGAQKLLGWFGGFGFEGTMQYFTKTVGLPWIIGFMVILIEFFGPIALLVGWRVQFWAAAIFAVMGGVMITTFHTYFFMNWFGSQPEEGFEFFLLMLGLSAAVAFGGAGKYAVSRKTN